MELAPRPRRGLGTNHEMDRPVSQKEAGRTRQSP